MTSTLRPFKLTPKLVPKIWGGHNLVDIWGKREALTPRERLGESWEVADLPEGQSVLASGPLQGKTLQEVVQAHATDLLGKTSEHDHFPLLVKLLDADDDLSVQVHPGKEHESLLPGARSKDEAWVILHTRPGGAILHGLESGVTRQQFADCIAAGDDPTALMRRHEVTPGEVVHVPPGTMHAICGGVSLLEIQQPSDTTYRVWDYNRPGLDGKPRDLHIEQALMVTNFGEQPPIIQPPRWLNASQAVLVDAEDYHIEQWVLDTDHTLLLGDTAHVLHVTEGALHLPDDNLTLNVGDSAIIPACCAKLALQVADKTTFVLAR